jgi:hypothetical protein
MTEADVESGARQRLGRQSADRYFIPPDFSSNDRRQSKGFAKFQK